MTAGAGRRKLRGVRKCGEPGTSRERVKGAARPRQSWTDFSYNGSGGVVSPGRWLDKQWSRGPKGLEK